MPREHIYRVATRRFGLPPDKRLPVLAGFLAFGMVYVARARFPGPHLTSYVLLAGMAGGVAISSLLRWNADEILVTGLLFAIPMADQLTYIPTVEGRMAEEVLLSMLIPLGLLWLIRHHLDPSSVGLSLGRRQMTLRMTSVFLVIAAIMSLAGLLFPSMTSYYPIWHTGEGVTACDFVYHESIIAVMMLGGEFFFRGLVLFTLARRSYWGAILLQSILYAFLHLGKPLVEVPYSLLAGIAFGWANLRSGSFLPSWLTHSIGSALFDALILLVLRS